MFHTGEITHIAVVQVYGYISMEDDTDLAVRARAFASYDDAIIWVEKIVRDAHGEEVVIAEYDGMAVCKTNGGPTWGVVIRKADITG